MKDCILPILAAAGAFACYLHAQDTRGEILSKVTDPSGAAVAGAKVTAVCATPKLSATCATDSTGACLLSTMPTGDYIVSVDAGGFHPYTSGPVAVLAGHTAELEIRLALRTARESIQVEARSSLVDTAGLASGLIVEGEELLQLPLRDGNPMNAAILAPGVSNLAEGGTTRAYDNENSSAIAVNGASSGSHEFKIDGASNTGGSSGNVASVPPAGGVAEFRIETSPFDARNGFSPGATINLSLKPGVNRVHGQISYFGENPAANANSFFANQSA